MSTPTSTDTVAQAPAANTAGAAAPAAAAPGAAGRHRRRALALAVLVLAGAAAAVVVLEPFGGSGSSPGAASTTASSVASVTRRSLSSQQSENGTLGFAGSYTVVNQAQGTITTLPSVGDVISPGHVLYKVSGEPVVLLEGTIPAYRRLYEGLSGKDVEQLNHSLLALGYATEGEIPADSEDFEAATKGALERLQEAIGAKVTGRLELGGAVFLPGALRIVKVSATLGGPASPGPVAEATSTRREVVVKLDAAQQVAIRPGDRVQITLPNGENTPGVVSSVGKVASTPSSGGHEEEGAPTIEVDIRPTDPRATGTLDQAPVKVAITTATVHNVLVVPVSSLLALSEGGYAVEVAEGKHRRLVGVTLGLFDDADGLVQASGHELQAGQQVVVPSTVG